MVGLPGWTRQKALRHAREAERRAGTFLPGSRESRHAMDVARYWRDRYRMDQDTVLPEGAPLLVRCIPDDTWFEASVGLALLRSWDLREPPGRDLLGRIESRVRERFPSASIQVAPAASGETGTVWIALREEPAAAVVVDDIAVSASPVRLEVRVFPRTDNAFGRRVSEVVESVSGPDAASGRLLRDLAVNALRRDYPNVRIVEQDALAQEPGVTVWYVYRDGRVVPSAVASDAPSSPARLRSEQLPGRQLPGD